MSSSMQQMAATLIERSKTLINNDLKRICKEEGLPQSGNKALLQSRVIGLINHAAHHNNSDSLRRLQHRVQNHGIAPPNAPVTPSTPAFPAHAANGYTMNGHQHNSHGPHHQRPHQQLPHRSTPSPFFPFKPSPFFTVSELVLQNITLETSPSHRQNSSKPLILNDAQCARMRSDPTMRLLLFSAIEQNPAALSPIDITFPSQIEVRVNGDEVKANYKGLKNKPGSTRPVDITKFVRVTPANYRNTLLVTYALTQKASNKKYNLYVYMVKKAPVEDLARGIKQRTLITKASVLKEMHAKANDPDIELGPSVMSLKDPISTLRIKVPCRSTICSHYQCFDAESFLQLQEQAPTWTCPICNKVLSFQALAVDEYFDEILRSVPAGTDQITIQPNGDWANQKDDGAANNGHSGLADSDDDLVEISDQRVTAIKSEAAQSPKSLTRTPPLSSRETSTAPRPGSKRSSEVIDLTLSDDDEPPRPAKKVSYNTPTSLPDPSRRYHQFPYGSSSAQMRSPPQTSMSTARLAPQYSSYGSYRQSSQRPNYPGQGTSRYPTYLDSSP